MDQEPTLEFVDVTKNYGLRRVLDGVTFAVNSGDVVGLVGPNGAGKTTLMRIAAGLQLADTGRVVAEGTGYYGGFDTLPLHGSVSDLRRGLGLHSVGGRSPRLSKLSRGELQWVGLSAVFELKCNVLLLDEPWTSLEPDRRDELTARIIDYAAAGRTVICSSHELDEVARVADEVFFIGGGRLRHHRSGVAGFDREFLLQLYREARASNNE